MKQLLQLTRELIQRPSVTPNDGGCQALLASRLSDVGFNCEQLDYGDVKNLWAVRGSNGPLLCFAGHTDVVPTGPEDQWTSAPFAPEIRDGVLFGRGAADMKGSLAAMNVACETFVREHPDHNGRIAMLLTSDEEGPALDGTRRVMETLHARGEKIDYCLVGEPSSSQQLGDVVRVGRRGSLHVAMTFHGVQGHVAYPEHANNPIHTAAPVLTALTQETWDNGNEVFPATSFQLSNIHGGTGATNVIPGILEVVGNFRYSTALTAEDIQQRTQAIVDQFDIECTLNWTLSGKPFYSEPGALTQAVRNTIRTRLDIDTECSTGGGTSDGRFIAPYGSEVVELGPINASIHRIDEQVSVDDLERLAVLYQDILERVLLNT